MAIKISGPIIKEQMAYFITDNNTTKGRDPDINIINGIHKIKGKNLSTYLFPITPTNTSPSHKEEYIGHLEPTTIDDTKINQTEAHQTNSVTLNKMMAEHVTPDIFDLPCHKLSSTIQNELDALLNQYESQFTKEKTSIGTTPLTSMTINTGDSDPVSQKPYPIAMKHYQWVKDKIENYLQPRSSAVADPVGQY